MRRPGPCMSKLAPTLLLSLALALAALFAPASAAAADPNCWKELVNDYWADNRVDKIYDVSCYREAMAKLPRDVQEYSDAQDDLRRALLDAIRDERSTSGFRDRSEDEGNTVAAGPGGDDQGGGGFFREVLDKLGPKNAESVPVPLLVLASIAILLLGAAGVSYGARWLQTRRGDLVPSPSPPHEPRG